MSAVTKQITDLTKKIDGLGKSLTDPDLKPTQLKNIVNELGKASSEMNKLKRVQDQFNQSGIKASASADRSANALSNLSRIAQDAPFGFIGITNNINPMLESFQRLQKETGGTGSALKALVSGLAGPAGLGFAVGIGSALLTVFGDKLFKAKKPVEELSESLAKYVKGLESVRGALLAGTQAAQAEIVKLKTLYEATQNANIPLAKRKELVDQLQKEYPKYFANITDETILAGGAKKAYDELSQAIIATARARAAQDSVVEIQKQILTLEQQQIDNAKEKEKASKELANAEARGITKINSLREGGVFQSAEGARLENKVTDAIKKGAEISRQKNELLERQKNLLGSIFKLTEENPDSLLNPGGNTPKVNSRETGNFNFFDKTFDELPDKATAKQRSEQAVKLYETAIEYALKNRDKLVGLDDLLSGMLKEPDKGKSVEMAEKFWKNVQDGLVKFKIPPLQIADVKLVPSKIEVDTSALQKSFASQFEIPAPKIELPNQDVLKSYDDFLKKFSNLGLVLPTINLGDFITADGLAKKLDPIISEFNRLREIASEISSVVAPAFTNLFDAILAGQDPLKAFFDGIIDSIKRVIKKLVEAAVQAAILSLVTGGAAGGGLSFLKAFGKIVGFADGGLAFGPTMGLVGEGRGTSRSNPEVIAPLDKLKKFIGGGQGGNVNVTGQFRVAGTDLVVALERTNKSRRRGY
jgi:hypothetical protein